MGLNPLLENGCQCSCQPSFFPILSKAFAVVFYLMENFHNPIERAQNILYAFIFFPPVIYLVYNI